MSIHDGDTPSGWSLEAYIAHNEEMRRLQDRFLEERDRRYTEVRAEQEKALKVKETAEAKALGLARDIQTYKDEKANELRSQIERERGTYATHSELASLSERFDSAHQPVLDYIAAQRGVSRGSGAAVAYALAGLGALSTVLAIITMVIVIVAQ